jgi:hypothetical protein
MIGITTSTTAVGDPMRDARGDDIGRVIERMLADSIHETIRPLETIKPIPDSVQSLTGYLWGSMFERLGQIAPSADPQGILTRGKTDSTGAFILHDSWLVHLLGLGLHPTVRARRNKTAMAEALEELATLRWRWNRTESALESAVIHARLRGTGAVHIYRTVSEPYVPFVEHIPTNCLFLDPFSGPDVNQTRWRAVKKLFPRSHLRMRWGSSVADHAQSTGTGRTIDEPGINNEPLPPQQWLARELEPIPVVEFFWCDGSFKRHMVLVNGINAPVEDKNRWPYELPAGRWPVIPYTWIRHPDSVWGMSDHRVSYVWLELIDWLVRFVSVAAAKAAKTVGAFDKGIAGGVQNMDRILGDLAQPFQIFPLDMHDLALSGIGIERLISFIEIPTNVQQLWQVLDQARQFFAEVTCLHEMEQKAQEPAREPPRLTRRQNQFREFAAEVLEVESCLAMQTMPQQAYVKLTDPSDIDENGKPKQPAMLLYMKLAEAEQLEKNTVPYAIENGIDGKSWDTQTLREKSLRFEKGIKEQHRISILDRGVEQILSRQSLVDAWEGPYVRPVAAITEYEFDVRVARPGDNNDQDLQRTGAVLTSLQQIYSQWGLEPATSQWRTAFQQWQQNKQGPPPAPPKLLLNILALHRDLVQASGTEYPTELNIRPEDLAYAIEAAGQAQQQQVQQQQQADTEIDRLKIQLQTFVQQTRLQIEAMRQQAEIARQWAEAMREYRAMQAQQAKTEAEFQKLPYLTQQQKARAQAAQSRAVQSQATAVKTVAEAQQAVQDVTGVQGPPTDMPPMPEMPPI